MFRKSSRFTARLAALATACLCMGAALAQDADAIRKTIAERMPKFPKIDAIAKSPIPGLYELRVGSNIYYTDDKADHLIDGQILDTKSHVNMTAERVDEFATIAFANLPTADALVWKSGTGLRKIAIFADPNCGYCKHFEQTLQSIKDVTVYTYLIPILGGDSPEKARAIWCARDGTAAWRSWMLDGKAPLRAMGACDTSALDRNLAAARRFRVQATPSIIFQDNFRVPGILDAEDVERHLAQAQSAKG